MAKDVPITRIADVLEWLRQGLEVSVSYPSEADQPFRATIEEFDISTQGESADAAIKAATDQLTTYIASLLSSDEPLPDRSRWLAKYGKTTDRGNG
jgi:predicted RNase H-like HicB family nuclease